MDQNNDSQPTAWFQSPITTARRRKLPIDPVILMIILPTLVLLLLFFFLHPLLSHVPKTIKLTSLKSTWDSLILFLVFFAILCGVFASTADATIPQNSIVSESYEYQEKSQVNGGLRRSSRSYPDLRQESESLRGNGENRLRFTDDFGADLQYRSSVNNGSRRKERGTKDIYRSETVSGDVLHRPRRSEVEEVYVEGRTELSRTVPESKVQLRPLSPQAPAPAPSISVKSRRRRTSRSLGREDTVDATSRIDKVQKVSNNPTPSPPPPPPLAPSEHRLHQKHNKLDGKLSESTTGLATKVDSADDQRKRKRKNKQKSKNIQPIAPSIQPPPPPPPPTVLHNSLKEEGVHKDSQTVPSAPPPAMPPPPPPLRSIFNALFKSGGKRKRFPSKTSPPPPPPSSIITGFLKIGTKRKHVKSASALSSSTRSTDPVTLKQDSKRKSQIQPPSPPLQPKVEAHRRRPAGTDKPPLPAKTLHSPLIPIPPSPPPFEVPAVKFQSPGDSVRLGSTHEPVPSSPDREPVDLPSATIDGEDSFGPNPVSFPSPDVNAKAESFISKRKDEWRMENINSVNKNWAHRPKSTTSPN